MAIPAHTPPERMRVAFLGSGSAGNAAVVTFGRSALLVDCGLSARETSRRLAAVGVDAGDVAAIVLTHEHFDHVRGLKAFASRTGAAVFATAGTARAHWLGVSSGSIEAVRPGEAFRVAEMSVTPFAVCHDVAEPVGYVFETPCGTRFGLATDMGRLTDEAAEALGDCDLLGLEANHDTDMLMGGSYPWFLKKRISSEVGHLSNADAADALGRVASARLRHVAAVHLSKFNNERGLAAGALRERLDALGLANVTVDAAEQDAVLEIGAARTDEAPPRLPGIFAPAPSEA